MWRKNRLVEKKSQCKGLTRLEGCCTAGFKPFWDVVYSQCLYCLCNESDQHNFWPYTVTISTRKILLNSIFTYWKSTQPRGHFSPHTKQWPSHISWEHCISFIAVTITFTLCRGRSVKRVSIIIPSKTCRYRIVARGRPPRRNKPARPETCPDFSVSFSHERGRRETARITPDRLVNSFFFRTKKASKVASANLKWVGLVFINLWKIIIVIRLFI